MEAEVVEIGYLAQGGGRTVMEKWRASGQTTQDRTFDPVDIRANSRNQSFPRIGNLESRQYPAGILGVGASAQFKHGQIRSAQLGDAASDLRVRFLLGRVTCADIQRQRK